MTLAEQTKTHLWINTGIAVLAFIASGTSAFYTWRSYELKGEAIDFTAYYTTDCKVEYHSGALGLCWVVTITDPSETPVTLVRHQAFDLSFQGKIYRSGFTEIEDGQDHPVSFPVTVDNGHPLTFVVRVPIGVSSKVVEILDRLIRESPNTPFRIKDFEGATNTLAMDIIGNQIDMNTFDGGQVKEWKSDYRVAIGVVDFESGSKNVFAAILKYPPGP
jgi:hypothetical protein